MPISCLALDFGGTLVRPSLSPNNDTVARVWFEIFDQALPDSYSSAFDTAQNEVNSVDREWAEHTPLEAILRLAAECIGILALISTTFAEAVFDAIADAVVDTRKVTILSQVCTTGLTCILACDTQILKTERCRALVVSRISNYFTSLVISSSLGVRKFHSLFFAAVLQRFTEVLTLYGWQELRNSYNGRTSQQRQMQKWW